LNIYIYIYKKVVSGRLLDGSYFTLTKWPKLQ
jgi:hypothetical protein